MLPRSITEAPAPPCIYGAFQKNASNRRVAVSQIEGRIPFTFHASRPRPRPPWPYVINVILEEADARETIRTVPGNLQNGQGANEF